MHWDWDENQRKLFEFTKKMIAIRREHPILHPRRYFKNRKIQGEGVFDIRWINTEGKDMSQEEWDTSFIRVMGMMLNGELMKEKDEFGNDLKQEILLILVNSYWESIPFTLPKDGLGEEWEIREDTSWEENPEAPVHVKNVFDLEARSLMLLRNIR